MVHEKTIDKEKFFRISKQIGFNYFVIIIQIALSPLLVAVLTRTLTVSEFGVYSLLIAFILLSNAFLELGFSQFIITKLSGMEIKKRIKIFYTIVKFEALFVGAVLLIFSITPLDDYFLKIVNLSEYSFELKISVLIVFLFVLARLFDSYFKAIKRINIANFMEMLRNKGWAIILIVIFLIFKKFTLANALEIWLVGVSIALVSYIILSRKEIIEFLKFKVRFHFLRKSLYFSIPLISVIIANWFLATSNKYILNFYTSTAIVGLFSLAYSFMGVITTFSAISSQVIQPYFTEAFSKKDHYNILINPSLKYGLLLVFPSIIGVVILRKELITLISGAKYLSAAPVVPTLALFPLFAIITFVFYQVMIAADRTVYAGIIHLIGGGFSILLNFILIPIYGMQGAAIATVLSYGFMALSLSIPGSKYVKIYGKFLKVPRILIASIIMGAILYFIKPDMAITKLITIAFGGFVYFVLIFLFKVFNKKEIAIIKKFVPKFLHPVLNYFAR